MFETVSEEQFSGRVVDRMIPPRGYNAVSTSGLLAYEAKGDKQQLPFGFGDLQVSGCCSRQFNRMSNVAYRCLQYNAHASTFTSYWFSIHFPCRITVGL